MENLFAQRNLIVNTDVVLKVGSQEVPCHKNILCASSSYFYRMFNGSSKEQTSGVVKFTDIDPPILKLIIDFIYTGKIKIATENAEAIVKASNSLDIPSLTGACGEFMSKQVEPANSLGFY